MNVIGEVGGRNVVIFDDVISTGKTVVRAAEALVQQGAREIYVGATHPVFSGPAEEYLTSPVVREIVVTDSLPLPPNRKWDKVRVLTVSRLLGEAIRRIHEERSLSSLFV